MEKRVEQRFALIMEASTEYQFYEALLLHFARKHPECTLEKQTDATSFEPYYVVFGPFGKRLLFLNAVGTITQLHNSISWFKSKCALSEKESLWTVFLCYDTDCYNADITKFYMDDWKVFRRELTDCPVKQIIDLAANAEIEDVFLQDLHGISMYLGLKQDLQPEDLPSGRKGSARLKQLIIRLRAQGLTSRYYHKGVRAQELISYLDLDKIIASQILPLHLLEQIFLEN